MIALQNVYLSFGDRILFQDISFLIDTRNRIGLVGNNGEGKSTLLHLILKKQQPDKGMVEVASEIKAGYLPQQMKVSDNTDLYSEVYKAFDAIIQLRHRLHEITRGLATREDFHSDAYTRLLDEMDQVNEQLNLLGEDKIHEQMEKTLLGLGFTREDFARPTSEFSGGWRMRIELAKILLQQPDILLLDEPTNHLDIESIQWLEDYLKDYSGAMVLISHDRRFLDAVTNRTIEISLGRIYDYKVSYSQFVDLQKERLEQQKAAYKNQQKEIAENERFIERFRYKASKAPQVQSRIKQLEKMKRIELDEQDLSTIHIRFQAPPRSGTIVIEAKEISKNYGNKAVLRKVDFIAERGERIAFVGKNGEGKSTFINIIAGKLDFKGQLKYGHNLSMGYFAQNQEALLDESKTVFETINEIAEGDIRSRIRNLLGAFLFRGEDIDKKVKVLSGGERSRLAMIQLLLKPYNLLILDEPTNHLDMRSKDILQSALNAYEGTVIVVSHDREFLDGFARKIYEFKDKQIREYLGSINDFLNEKRRLFEATGMKNNTTGQKTKTDNPENRKDHQKKKHKDRQKKKIENKIKQSEKKIQQLEQEMHEINKKLEDPQSHDLSADMDIFEAYQSLRNDHDAEMQNWESLQFELENLLQSYG